jgi:hypothetical protein
MFIKDTCTISVPLSNPFDKDIELRASVEGQYLEGDASISIKSKNKTKYELKFSPKRIGSFKGRCVPTKHTIKIVDYFYIFLLV